MSETVRVPVIASTRHARRHAVASVAAAVALLLACDPPHGAGASVLANPGFDVATQDNGIPHGWSIDAAARARGQVGAAFVGGTRVLSLQPNGGNVGDPVFGLGQLLDATAWRGHELDVRASLGASGGATAVLGVSILGKSGALGFVQLRQDDTQGALKAQADKLQVPAAAQQIVVYVGSPSTSGTALIGPVTLSMANAPGATPTAATTPTTQSATITIDPKSVVRQIPATLFGTNAEWVFDGQGLWNGTLKKLDPTELALSKSMGPTVIRFPGGVFSDAYHWKDGVGPEGSRPTTPNYPNGPTSRHSIGTPEIAEVARNAGAELLLTVNAGSGTAQEAAGWVAYAKQNVQPRVRFWEVGNELYMKGDLSGGSMSATDYGRKFLSYAAAMRGVDPDIRLGAIGGLNYGNYRFISDNDWTDKVLAAAAPQIDFLAVHDAYAPLLIGVDPSIDPKSVYRAMFAAPQQIEANLAQLSTLLDKRETPTRHISLAVTEWGPSFHVLPTSPWVDHVKTMGSALFVASTLDAFVRTPRLEVANFFKLTDYSFMGWIGRRGNDWEITAPGMAFSLYRHQLGQTLVRTQVASPVFDTTSIGAIAAATRVPWVDAVATYDHGALVVMLVNRSDEHPFDDAIVLKGVRGYSDVTVQGIDADALDSNTGTQLPAIPGIAWAKQIDIARFPQGAPGEIHTLQATLPAQTATGSADVHVTYHVPPLSIVAIRFGKVQLR